MLATEKQKHESQTHHLESSQKRIMDEIRQVEAQIKQKEQECDEKVGIWQEKYLTMDLRLQETKSECSIATTSLEALETKMETAKHMNQYYTNQDH